MLVGYARNTTDNARSFKWTAPRAQNATAMRVFNRNTAIEIATAWPVNGLSDIRATKFSACLAKSFTHTETSPSEWGESAAHVVIAMAAKRKSVAIYQIDSRYELVREDGTEVAIAFGYTDDTSFYMTEYPPEQGDATIVIAQSVTGSPLDAGTAQNTSEVGVISLPAPEMSAVIDSVP